MSSPRMLSPARSQGAVLSPRRNKRRKTRSVGSPAISNASGRLSSIIEEYRKQNMESFLLSPMDRRSMLTDNTDIEEPKRKSWWKRLNENTRDVMEVLEENKAIEPNNIIEELDIEVLSQEKKNYTLDLPESSDSESISSIVIPQRKLFTEKENLPQIKYNHFGTRDTLSKLPKTNTAASEKPVSIATKELFQNKPRSRPIFPAALLNMSPDKTTGDKTLTAPEPIGQARNIFGNRQGTKRKNMFANFIVSDSEDEIPEIQPKIFEFQKKPEVVRRPSTTSRCLRDSSPSSSITAAMELDDWKLLPSSTMVETQLEAMMAGGQTPKRARLSKLSEAKESVVETNSTDTDNKTKQLNRSTLFKNTSKDVKDKSFELDTSISTKNSSIVNTGRNKSHVIEENQDTSINKSQNNASKIKNTSKNSSKLTKNYDKASAIKNQESLSKTASKSLLNAQNQNVVNPQEQNVANLSFAHLEPEAHNNDELNFTLEYDNEDIADEIGVAKEGKLQSNSVTSNIKTKDSLENNCSHKQLRATTNNKEDQEVLDVVMDKIEESQQLDHSQDIESENKVNESQKGQNGSKKEQNKSHNERQEKQTVSQEIHHANHEEPNVNQEQQNQSRTKYDKSKGIQDISQEEQNESPEMLNESQKEQNEGQEKQNESKEQNESNKHNVSQEIRQENQKDCNESQEAQNDSEEEQNENNMEQNKSEEEQNFSQEIQKSQEDHNENQEEQNESQEAQNESKEEQNESEEERSESEEEQNMSQEIQNSQEDHNENHEEQNESQEAQNESEEEQNESEEEQNESEEEQNISQEIQNSQEDHSENQEEQNESQEEQNESQEAQNESEEEQNESKEEQNKSEEEQNVSEEEQNISQEIQHESHDEHIESQEIQNETEEEVNASEDENGDLEMEYDVNESADEEAVEKSDQETDVDHESDSDQNENQDNHYQNEYNEEIDTDTPNISHDTTGRNRKKLESPELILHNAKNHAESITVHRRKTSDIKTKSMFQNPDIRPRLIRESVSLSDGTKNSTAEGSGWDSHRTTRKTLRQTFGKDFTPRKSLRALVMEKSAKRQTVATDVTLMTAKFPLANSTELPEESTRRDDYEEMNDEPLESNHEVSRRTRQTKLEEYLQKIQKQNMECKMKIDEAVRKSLKAPSRDVLNPFKVPAKPMFPRRSTTKTAKPKAKPKNSVITLDDLPEEVIEDMKYKPPKRFQPKNAPWITKRLYKYLETKLEPKYDYKARVRTEKLVETLYHFAKEARRHQVAPVDAVDVLKHEMARLDVVKTHFDFYEFIDQFMPREIIIKVIPDIVNNIPEPRNGVFADILRRNDL